MRLLAHSGMGDRAVSRHHLGVPTWAAAAYLGTWSQGQGSVCYLGGATLVASVAVLWAIACPTGPRREVRASSYGSADHPMANG
jgi:hypothetical protein